MKYLGLMLVALLLSSCVDIPARDRERIRRDVEVAEGNEQIELRQQLIENLLGGTDTPRHNDPHIRASSAQGLGDIGSPEDATALVAGLLGPYRDDSEQVRMECAIALGKLRYPSADDDRRQRVIESLRQRMAFERDQSGRLVENSYLVRLSMLNTLIYLGGRDAAAAVHDIATRLHQDLADPLSALESSPNEAGLLDRCFEGLMEMTGVDRQTANNERAKNDLLDPYLEWWVARIAEMPA